MKKIILPLFLVLVSVFSFAQTNPNRVVIYQQGDANGYLVERIDSIMFPKVEGEVKAELECMGVDMESKFFKVKVTRTPNCVAFKINYLPTVTANRLNEVGLVNYINSTSQNFYYQDFTDGQLTGDVSIDYDTEYSIVTVGYDAYKTPCSVSRVDITTPKRDLVGSPSVEIKTTKVEGRVIEAHFVPTADVLNYYVLIMEPSQFEEQFNMFAPMLGFKNHGDMVKGFGAAFGCEETDFAWDELKPNTDYRIYVQAVDVNETYAEMNTLDVKTAKLGGEGEAKVEVTLGDYTIEEWPSEGGGTVKSPTQYMTFTPNDQTASFRVSVFAKKDYEAEKENIQNSMKEAGYDFYETYSDAFMVQAETTYVAVAVGQNAKGEWGAFTEYEFTTGPTPEKTPVVRVGKGAVRHRTLAVKPSLFEQGKGFALDVNGANQNKGLIEK